MKPNDSRIGKLIYANESWHTVPRIMDTSIFTRAISPIIIKTAPGSTAAVARDYRQYELTQRAPSRSRFMSVGSSVIAPNIGPIANLLATEFSTPLTLYGVFQKFNYIVGAWSGNDIMDIADDSRVLQVWNDRIDKRILTYEKLYIPYPVADEAYTYSVVSGRNGQRMYFTSLQEIRHLVGADVANQKGYNGAGVNAVVADTGGARHNPMLHNMIKQTAIPGIHVDENGHGSWVASALAGKEAKDHVFSLSNQGKPPVINQGMAPGSNLTQIKCLGFVVGQGSDSMLLRSLHMALGDKADVLNVSWGGSITSAEPQDDPFYDPMQVLMDSNTIVSAASGDSGPNAGTCDTPGALPNVLSVGSINAVSNGQPYGAAGEVSDFSSRGPAWGEIRPDTVSYGAIVDGAITPVLDASYTHVVHQYQALAGTSQAAPVVSGLMAIMKQIYRQKVKKELNLVEVKTMLSQMGHAKSNADGWGLLTYGMIEDWISTQYGVII